MIILGIIGGMYRLAGPSPDLMLFPASPIRSEILPPNSRNTTTPIIKRCQCGKTRCGREATSRLPVQYLSGPIRNLAYCENKRQISFLNHSRMAFYRATDEPDAPPGIGVQPLLGDHLSWRPLLISNLLIGDMILQNQALPVPCL